jgi:hypothetical protein
VFAIDAYNPRVDEFGLKNTLKVSLAGAGSGSVSSNPAGISCLGTCSHSYASGTMVTLTATPAAGSGLAGWSGGGCSGTSACKVTMSSVNTVTATFEVVPMWLLLRREQGSVGSAAAPESRRPAAEALIAARSWLNVVVRNSSYGNRRAVLRAHKLEGVTPWP